MNPFIQILSLAALLSACASSAGSSSSVVSAAVELGSETAPAASKPVSRYKAKVVASYNHDRSSYTQGLFFLDGQMYESTGQYGESTFRKVDLATGRAVFRESFASRYFVEGSTELNGKIYILTWREKKVFVYDSRTLKMEEERRYGREGWGLTTDGSQLIASDGSEYLFFLDEELRTRKKLKVTLSGMPVRLLNELEYIDGKVWANVYTKDQILIIDPSSGAVEGIVDCTGLLPDNLRKADTDVLNGIAAFDGRIFVTGKYWPKLYEIEIVPR